MSRNFPKVLATSHLDFANSHPPTHNESFPHTPWVITPTYDVSFSFITICRHPDTCFCHCNLAAHNHQRSKMINTSWWLVIMSNSKWWTPSITIHYLPAITVIHHIQYHNPSSQIPYMSCLVVTAWVGMHPHAATTSRKKSRSITSKDPQWYAVGIVWVMPCNTLIPSNLIWRSNNSI